MYKKHIGLLDTSLCNGCGFCAAICPSNAILLTTRKGFYKIHVNEARCSGCGLCLRICPSIPNSNQLTSDFEHASYNPLIGNYIAVFLGSATDNKLRCHASSGGCVTSLLTYALDKGLVDETFVALSDEKNPTYGKAVATSDIDITREATGSKYTQIYMVDALRRVIRLTNKRFSFVGLPCHIKALRNVEHVLKLQNIVIRLGLYCGNLPSAWASEYLAYLYGIPKHEIKRISYRGLGWPGYLTLELVDGEKLCIPESLYYGSGFGQYFCDKCCILCPDHTAELADISFADPWNVKEVNNDRLGRTLVVARSRAGLEFLKAAEKDGYINLSKICAKCAVQDTTVLKKVDRARIAIYKLLGIHQKSKYRYVLPYRSLILVWIIDYAIGHALAMNRRLWMFIPIWRRLAEIVYLGVKMPSKSANLEKLLDQYL